MDDFIDECPEEIQPKVRHAKADRPRTSKEAYKAGSVGKSQDLSHSDISEI
jgi:hypothetical protein